MTLPVGTRLGPYEIVAPLGAGGMGVVYRGTDTRLDRPVAIKVLSAHLSADPQLRQRFDREARAISSLNHPHICALYDVGEVEAARFLVMELIEGESLAERLIKGPLPFAQALQYGIEIIDALSSAHRRGIVHRDVKPGNVMLTKAGAKLLDFGLAKSGPALRAADPHAETTWTPASSGLTAHGALVGTFQYMAPEQLEGLDVDARTDIFAFGAVLFEMLTGRKAFVAKTQTSLIGAILKDEPPPVSSVVPVSPAALDRIIAKCLAKDPDARWQDASDLRDELQWIAAGGRQSTWPKIPAAIGRTREWVAWALCAVALAGLGAAYLRPVTSPAIVRFALSPPPGVVFAPVGAPVAPFPAVSPDGTRLVFVASRQGEAAMLWTQSFDSLEARPLNDTTVRTDTLSPALPFWSPDSRSVGFFADGKLKRIDIGASSPQVICDAPQSGGAAWGADGTIVFASKIDEGLRKVAASGGTPVQMTKPDPGRGEISHSNPAFLSDGRHFLFWVQAAKPSIRIGSVDSAETTYLVDADSRAAYGSGFVVFVRQGALVALPFDEKRLVSTGEPRPVADDVRTFQQNGRSAFSVSANGVLVYRTGSVASARSLAWLDRQGRQIAIVPGSTALYGASSLIADDRHLVAQIEDAGTTDLWLIDLAEGSRSRLTSDPKSEGSPVVAPDGRLVVFASDRNGVDDLFQTRADGAGGEQTIIKSGLNAAVRKYPTDWSPHWISFTVFDATRKQDLWTVDGQGAARPYLQTEFSERDGHLSPDERWMVYTSDEAGTDAVYVRPFPNAGGGKWRVSGAGGGSSPRWRADGKEIFYVDDRGQMTAVSTASGASSPELGQPRVLFRLAGASRGGYAVSRDGSRFLVASAGETSRVDVPVTVVLNWPTLLKR